MQSRQLSRIRCLLWGLRLGVIHFFTVMKMYFHRDEKVFHRDENVFSPRWKKIFMQHHVKPDHRHFFKVWRTRSDYEVYPTVSFVFAIPPESGWLALAAYQHRRKLGNAMLRKSERHVASSSPTLWGRKLRPQRSIFFFRQFKHKIAKQPLSSYLAIIHRGPTWAWIKDSLIMRPRN